jgi:hypothetical protein
VRLVPSREFYPEYFKANGQLENAIIENEIILKWTLSGIY